MTVVIHTVQIILLLSHFAPLVRLIRSSMYSYLFVVPPHCLLQPTLEFFLAYSRLQPPVFEYRGMYLFLILSPSKFRHVD
ncbi:hypothetical protein BKA65DRAFT_499855 [Rhexocercosporidium sp. MPI-PUGE-AT-0058]|nr:hypothetical protein BKA65DRAFT_499855 [Rhexocercosporidium sp. MPI-PUGE-AT-0058]